MTTGERFERAVGIMARLRAPGGCPWDREQTFDTIKRYTLEETYEVLEAIDNRDWPELTIELGDLLLQVLFYSEMAQEEKRFSIDDVLDALCDKLISRHPHVFGDVKAETSHQVLKNWEEVKAEEKKRKKKAQEAAAGTPRKEILDGTDGLVSPGGHGNLPIESVLDGVSSKMPALIEAHKISSKAAHVGFDWQETQGLFDKLAEEGQELQADLREIPPGALKPENNSRIPEELRERIEGEVGDLFFVLINIARHLAVDAESALRKTNNKFRRRFSWMEQRLHERNKKPKDSNMEEMEALWQEAKKVTG